MIETEVIDAPLDEEMPAIEKAAALLCEGEVVALPTETVYGLAANAFDAKALAKVFEVKERPTFDPLIVHVGSREDLKKVAAVPAELEETVGLLTKAFWPGPLTLVLPRQPEVPDLVTAGLDTVAVRMSDNPVMKGVARKVGPIAAPSANRFGRISPTSATAVVDELGGRIPLVVNGGACRDGVESTIISIEPGEKRPTFRLLRAGPVVKEDLQKFGKVVKAGRVTDKKLAAPGQLPSHYAPKCRVEIVDQIREYKFEEGLSYGLLAHKGLPKDGYIEAHDWAAQEVLSPGNGKLAEAAVRLFYCLRALDAAGVDVIVVQPVSEVGIGVAIMDRLRRAAADRTGMPHA